MLPPFANSSPSGFSSSYPSSISSIIFSFETSSNFDKDDFVRKQNSENDDEQGDYEEDNEEDDEQELF